MNTVMGRWRGAGHPAAAAASVKLCYGEVVLDEVPEAGKEAETVSGGGEARERSAVMRARCAGRRLGAGAITRVWLRQTRGPRRWRLHHRDEA